MKNEITKIDQLKSLISEVSKEEVNDLLIELGLIVVKSEKVQSISKSQLGKKVLEECFENNVQVVKREFILKRLEEECNMGHNYGSTFLTNYRKSIGLN